MLVKVLWQHRGVEKAIWEREDTICATYPSLFEDEGTLFSHLKKKMVVAYACDCVYVRVNFGTKLF